MGKTRRSGTESPAEVRKFLVSGEHPEEYIRWVNQNVDKWMNEGKHVYVDGANGYFAVVTDANHKPDMKIFEEYKALSDSKPASLTPASQDIGDPEEARRLLQAEIKLKEASEGKDMPKGFTAPSYGNVSATPTATT